MLTGEAPDHHPGVRRRLAQLGFGDFTAYVVWACERALERGLLPHTNLGVLSREDLARLREVTASQGLMLESVNPDLVAHQGSPTKHPAERLATIAAAEELRIPFTSGILVGIGESEEDRMAALEALAGFEHLQEVILQNFVPHRRYYGEEPAEIAADAADGVLAHRSPRRSGPRRSGLGVAGGDRGHEAPDRRDPAADARRRHPGAAEPRRLVAGAGGRGRHRPRRPVRQRRPHLARAPVPVAAPGAAAAGGGRGRARRAAVRVPALHRPRVDRPARARRDPRAISPVHPAPRRGGHGAGDARARPRRPAARSR